MNMTKARLIPSLCERIIRFYSTNPSSIVFKENEEFLDDIGSSGRIWGYLIDSDSEYFYETKEIRAVYQAANCLLEILGTNNPNEQGMLDVFGCLLISTQEEIEGEIHKDAWTSAEAILSDRYDDKETYAEKLRNYIGSL